jgi:hypothetical protein
MNFLKFPWFSAPQDSAGFHSFGPYKIQNEEIFFTSNHSFAFLSPKPVVPGQYFVIGLMLETSCQANMCGCELNLTLDLHFAFTGHILLIKRCAQVLYHH